MGWLRNNWLDALIFLLVALVMAGVVFFLTGVNPFSRFQNAGQTPAVAAKPPPPAKPQQVSPAKPQQVTPAKPQQVTPETKPAATLRPETKPAAKPVVVEPVKVEPTIEPVAAKPVTAKPVGAAKPVPVQPEKPVTKPTVIKELDASPEPVVMVQPKPTRPSAISEVPKPVRLPAQLPLAQVQAKPKAVEAVKPAAAPTRAQSRPTQAAQTTTRQAASRGDASGNWQVSAGSFANAANAEALASRLRSQGWKAQVVRVGNYNRVYVGPYTSGPRARAAASAIGGGARAFSGLGAVSSVAAPTPVATATAKSTPSRVEIRLGSAAVYLQAGAYKNLQNAQPAINRLKAEGYPVQVVEGQLVRVRVGPVSNKTEVIAKLRRLGFSAFEVK
jgi:cell division septation protein DedD